MSALFAALSHRVHCNSDIASQARRGDSDQQPSLACATPFVPVGSLPLAKNAGIHLVYISDGLCTYRKTGLLILRTLVQFYILPHTPTCSVRRVCVCTYYTRLSRTTADSAWLSKQLENSVALEPSKQPTEVARQWASSLSCELQTPLEERNFAVSSQVLSRQIVHNTVGSLQLAKNALHSPTSIIICASLALPAYFATPTRKKWSGTASINDPYTLQL